METPSLQDGAKQEKHISLPGLIVLQAASLLSLMAVDSGLTAAADGLFMMRLVVLGLRNVQE